MPSLYCAFGGSGGGGTGAGAVTGAIWSTTAGGNSGVATGAGEAGRIGVALAAPFAGAARDGVRAFAGRSAGAAAIVTTAGSGGADSGAAIAGAGIAGRRVSACPANRSAAAFV